MYNVGKFKSVVSNTPSNILYLDSVNTKMKLTDYEKGLLKKNGFMVTERLAAKEFINMFSTIWTDDLPVFITTDAILNALHESYDLILKGIEIKFLIPKLTELLNTLHSSMNRLEQKYSSNPALMQNLKDVDVYLTIPRRIIQSGSVPYYSNNNLILDSLLNDIESDSLLEKPIFGTVKRYIDYSQFKPRGHYTDENYPQLAKYFKAMMWLGKIELYLIAPQSAETDSTIKADVKRQTIDAFLLLDLIKLSGSKQIIDEIEKTTKAFIGEQDNVTTEQLEIVTNDIQINSALDFLDEVTLDKFQDTLASKSFAEQKILSQVLMSDPGDPEQIKPASAFMLFGQRFVIDSYITGNVVYDKIIFENQKIKRMLPSTLDILFALGNSAASQILEPEMDKYNYSSNLASLRYLIDSYGSDFWNNSIYNMWLNSIRTLNSPKDRSSLPEFMQTAAWWQQKMNTQLASWTELRHDNLLYAKQSYTGGITCSYPYGYVEPIPSFYKSLKNLAQLTAEKFASLTFSMSDEIYFFNGFASVMDTLEIISQKELDKIELIEAEKKFVESVLYTRSVICGGDPIDGWYNMKLIFKSPYSHASMDPRDSKYIVADYHTTPTDEMGGRVGWVKHSGTGPINLCVVVADIPNVGNVAFAGPVSSYYEYTTKDFERLTDELWRETYLQTSVRPDWVNVYLADSKGDFRGSGAMLITDVKQENQNGDQLPGDMVLIQNYPNPFNPQTTIQFNVPFNLTNSLTELRVFNVNGQLVKKLLSKELPSGNYLVRWDGTNEARQMVSSGVYIYQLKVGTVLKAGKMNLLK
jgi:hypothetical protein